MKYTQYVIQYSLITYYEAILIAQSKKEAVEKVITVVGEPIKVCSVRKLKGKSEK